MKFRILMTILCLLLVLGMGQAVFAQETLEAMDISAETSVTGNGYQDFRFLFDKDIYDYRRSAKDVEITLENPEGMASLYLLFDMEYGEYTVTDNSTGAQLTAGTYGFLHEFLDLKQAFGAAPTSVTLCFQGNTLRISELYVFSAGTVPSFVQRWQPPLEGGADILMLPTHGDDDQLFFAGLVPYYAGELDCRVQVVYMTDHRCYTTLRTHEMLNGLWAVGADVYPVFGSYVDFRVDSLQGSYQTYANLGHTKEDMVGFVVEQIRRFKPLVVVGHDVNGEYGHGMHRVYADMLVSAVEVSADPEAYPELAEKYGVWDVPKTYLHLWEENPIEINYDIPLERFDGLTAFQVTQKYGFPCHVTQQQYWSFVIWINGNNGEITKATEIETYNPCKFGLYRSTVGNDVLKNDFLENVTTYAEQERLEAERLEQERLEAERLEQQRLEAERLEAERLEQERLEAERQEQERLAQERLEQERLEQELLEELQQAMEQERQKQRIIVLCVFVVIGVGYYSYRKAKKTHQKTPKIKK